MKNKKSISIPIRGMNLDSIDLKNTEYRIAINANTNNETGEGFNIQNESSNTLGIVFPEGYKVIGFRNDLILPRTYYILTNPTTKKSSIGYVENNVEDTFNQDQEATCVDCSEYNELSIPLELTTQTPSLEYIELVNDECSGELNFDINFPIKKIEIKQEKLGTYLYWNDNNNPPRYINISDISYLFTQEVSCEDDIVLQCPNFDKLLIFPKHNTLEIDAQEVQVGGNLKLGTYEFYVAYCDLLGNEMTAYSTPTNPISIFDENNNILSQTELDTFTNFAIKLKIKNLNTAYFKYYKVVCVERNNVDNAQTAFIEGIHPTTDDTILYTHSGSSSDDFITRGNVSIKRRIDFNKLNLIKPYYDKAETTMVSGGRLWHKSLTKREELNLQPVVNLFGALALQWQTSVAREDLYKSAIATSKYKGYMSDEVQPFALRFYFKDGDYSPVFPIVGRPLLQGEDDIIEDKNLSSLIANSPNCTLNERNKKWQLFNTAFETTDCTDINTGIEIQETEKKTCILGNVFTIEAGSTTIELTEEYTNLKEYIEDNPDIVISGITEHLEADYPEDHCYPTFTGDCVEPELIDFSNFIDIVENEQITKTESIFPDDYQPCRAPEYCNIYKQDFTSGSSGLITDDKFRAEFMYDTMAFRVRQFYNVKERDYNFTNENCSTAEDIVNILNVSDTVGGYFHNYIGATLLSELQTSKTAIVTNTNFSDKIHKGALWFRANVNNRDKFILELSKIKTQGNKDDIVSSTFNSDKEVRVSLFNKCSDTTPFYSEIISLKTSGLQLKINVNYTDEEVTIDNGATSSTVSVPNVFSSNNFLAVVDDPIYECEGIADWSSDGEEQSEVLVDKVRTAPIDGCYSIVTRDITYSSATVSWDSITINKKETWATTCTFILPKVDECEPQPYRKGEFAYWESTETYPDNEELYNSSNIAIKPSDLEGLSEEEFTRFSNFFLDTETLDGQGKYVLKQNTDLRCQPIRIPKFPDNIVAPFLYDSLSSQKFSDGLIFPLGITINSQWVNKMLQVALNNELITQKEFDNIEGYEILKGDNSIHKSIITNALGFDMYNYQDTNEDTWWYPNFPFNDLGYDKYHTKDKSRRELIGHPYDSSSNHLFSVLSPDLALTRPALPTEVSLTGFQFGNALSSINKVKDHPKYTILGSKARTLATTLAIAEVVLETLIKAGETTSRQWFTFGTSSGASLGFVGTAIVTGVYAVQGFMKIGQYRYDWLKIFRDLGTSYNFANMHVGVGEYNRFLKNESTDDYLRALSVKKYLKEGYFNTVDENDGQRLNVNNHLREDSVMISTGEDYQFSYPMEYILNDNNIVNSKSSKFLSSDIDCEDNEKSVRDIASPYFTLKNYIPDQWGTIDSIKWLTTNYRFSVEDITDCKTIFGGTIVISPYSVRRKTPMFSTTGMGLPDKLPFNYSEYKNIGYPKYYIDYEVDTEYSGLLLPFPDIDSDYTLDCSTGSRRFYVKPPSKFYLYSYGIVNFLVQSEINCHFRYAKKEQKDLFYQKGMNVEKWVQETNLSINEPNTFYYNNTYSFPVSNTPYKYLDTTYNRDIWRKRNIQPNAVIYSEVDNNENDITDSWLVYKPLNWYEYKTSLGKLIDLKDIESMQFLARFENGLILNNAIDSLADRITPQNREIGTAGIFAERPLEFKTTDLGFAGTSTIEMCSTPFGHFWIDAKRGKIFQLDQNGKNLETVSEVVQGQPTNMKQWFKEHLPFKILKYIPNIDIDNKFKGIGLNMWWDDRFSRLFITKRDYILQTGISTNDFYFEPLNNKLYYQEEEIFFDDEEVFKDVSWTISYKPQEGSWNSYFSFYPDYSPFHNGFFQVGYNFGQDQETLWSHLLNNSSFQVFQGRLNSFVVEFPIQNENVLKQFNSLALSVEARRYQNKWDFSIWKDKGFNKFSIFNNTQHSGELNLFVQKTLADTRKFPKTNPNNTQDILFTAVNGKHNINYFFNRTINQQRNIPMWLKDENNIFKEINPRAISFTGKRTLERIVSNEAIVRLENDLESRFNIILKSSINSETVIE